jgi:hypothetical protein
VKNLIFDDPFHKKRTNIGHFGARDDPTIRIKKFFDETGLERWVRPVRLQRQMRLQRF